MGAACPGAASTRGAAHSTRAHLPTLDPATIQLTCGHAPASATFSLLVSARERERDCGMRKIKVSLR